MPACGARTGLSAVPVVLALAGTTHARAVRNGIRGQDTQDSLLGRGQGGAVVGTLTLLRVRCTPDSEVLCSAEGLPSKMSPARRPTRIDPLDPFAIVLRTDSAAAPVVLQSARDADRATVAFHAEKQRLQQRRVVGDLLLVHQQKARTLLWEPLR